MAPTRQFKPTKAASSMKRSLTEFFATPMARIANGTAVFSDDFAKAMAEGKKVLLPKDMDKIVQDGCQG